MSEQQDQDAAAQAEAAMARFVAGLRGLAEAMKAPQRTVYDVAAGMTMGAHRIVEASRRCCSVPVRDGVIVTVPSRERVQAHREGAPESDMRLVMLTLWDGHRQSLEAGIYDIEDMKRLVNLLSEAIAEAEAMYGEMGLLG